MMHEEMVSEETKQRMVESLSPFFPGQRIQISLENQSYSREDASYGIWALKSKRILGVIPWFPKCQFVASLYLQSGTFAIGCGDENHKAAIKTAITRE